MSPTITACASALPAQVALIRLSGPQSFAIAERAGVPHAAITPLILGRWVLGPVRAAWLRGPRTATGHDTVELRIPGAPDLVAAALDHLRHAGAEPAAPGAFTRQALANGRLSLDQALAVLRLIHARDAGAAAEALERLTGALAKQLAPLRERLLHLRALVEAGLDFLDEHDVRAFDPVRLRAELAVARDAVARFRRTADEVAGVPRVLLVGPANAGKSALFAALTGATALISPIPGTTRDWLEADWIVGHHRVRLVDTAGWLDGATELDAAGIAAGRAQLAGATLVLACSAPDARLPADLTNLPATTTRVIATKRDLGGIDPRAVLSVSATSGQHLEALATLVQQHLDGSLGDTGADPRQERLLSDAYHHLARLADRLPADELLADDLRRIADLLGDLLGVTTSDEVLDAIFSQFCIGK